MDTWDKEEMQWHKTWGDTENVLISRWINRSAWVTEARCADSQSKHQSELVLRKKMLLEVKIVDINV